MINILLPLAGKGSRFSNAGYDRPKPLIEINGKPMIEVVINNLRPTRDHHFIFICQQRHIDEYGLDTVLKNLEPNSTIITIDHYTDGQLSSAMLAKQYIDNDFPLMTANTDQYIDFSIDHYLSTFDDQSLDGLIMTMKGENPKWSYVRINEATNLVVETAEKKVISNEATVGIYNFKRGSDFVKAAESIIKKDIRVNGEFYICPVYNELIAKGFKVGYYNIGEERGGMYGLGIPDDLEYFLSHPLARRV